MGKLRFVYTTALRIIMVFVLLSPDLIEEPNMVGLL